MEILNEMFTENQNGYFNYQEFKRNQVLTEAFEPPTTQDIFMDKPLSFQYKKPSEIRIIVADLAFAGKTNKAKNDNTIFQCTSLHWKKFRFERHEDYITSRPGGGADKVVLKLKELFWDYQADYIVMDIRSGGEAVYDYLSNTTEHPERGSQWNPCGFTVVNDESLQIASPGKIEELRGRTADKNALPCIIPIVGTSEINSLGWQMLKKQLETNNYKFLITMQEAQNNFEDSGEYFRMTSEDYANKVAPYGQTDLMVQECVNLEAEYRNGLVRLTEPRNGFKDRAVVLSYSNMFAEKLDNKYIKNSQKLDYDINEIQLVW